MWIQSGRHSRTTRVGFTLVELLLVVVLLGLLFGAVVFSLDSLQRGARLEEGAGQMETLLRFARAQASSSGRQVRIVFGPADSLSTGSTPAASTSKASTSGSETAGRSTSTSTSSSASESAATVFSDSGIAVEWEPDPIGAPGRFEPLREAAPYLEQIGALVLVRPVPRTATGVTNGSMLKGFEPSPVPAGDTNSAATGSSMPIDADLAGAGGPPPPLVFYPDGSSDTYELSIQSQDETEVRRVVISLAGLTGTIRSRWVSPDGSDPASDSLDKSTSPEPGASGSAPAVSGGRSAGGGVSP